MDVVFLDANVLFSAAYLSNAGLRRLWELNGIELLTSQYAAEEARRNLPEPAQRQRLENLLSGMRIVTETDDSAIGGLAVSGLPDKDLPILATAISARSTHLLTGDLKHFGHLFGKKVDDVAILTPGYYINARLGESRRAE